MELAIASCLKATRCVVAEQPRASEPWEGNLQKSFCKLLKKNETRGAAAAENCKKLQKKTERCTGTQIEWSERDRLRHCKLVALRDDKDPREVVKEA